MSGVLRSDCAEPSANLTFPPGETRGSLTPNAMGPAAESGATDSLVIPLDVSEASGMSVAASAVCDSPNRSAAAAAAPPLARTRLRLDGTGDFGALATLFGVPL